MGFTNTTLDKTYPRGTQKVSSLDDAIRETRAWLMDFASDMTGYPDSVTVKIATWTTATRPTTPNMIGYNTTTGCIEYINSSGTALEPISAIKTSIAALGDDKLNVSEVANTANHVPRYNSSGHLVLPGGAELWVG